MTYVSHQGVPADLLQLLTGFATMLAQAQQLPQARQRPMLQLQGPPTLPLAASVRADSAPRTPSEASSGTRYQLYSTSFI